MAEYTRNNFPPAQTCESPQHESGPAFLSHSAQHKRPGPTSYEAQQALRVLTRYAEANFDVCQDAKFLLFLGRMHEKLERQQRGREFLDICVHTGLHSVDRE